MQQIRLMSKFGLALMAIAVISVAVATQVYNIQAADAQAKLPNNSVRSENIVDGQVKTADLANDAVTTAKIADGTIQEEDIASGAIPTDTVGSLQTTIKRESREITSHASWTFEVDCDPGQVVTGGGYIALPGSTGDRLEPIANFPLDSNTWFVTISIPNDNDNTHSVSTYAVCAAITQ